MIKRSIVVIIMVFCCLFAFTDGSNGLQAEEKAKEQSEKDTAQEDYTKLRAQFMELYRQKKIREAIRLLEQNMDNHPAFIQNIGYNIAILCAQIQDYGKGIAALEKVLQKGLWFNVWTFEDKAFQAYKDQPGFDKIIAMNNQLRDQAQKKSKPDLTVVTPIGFHYSKKYPLFIALHGGGGNIKAFRTKWISQILKTEFIVAYVQSSQIVSMTGYAWNDLDIAKKEVAAAYKKIINEYPVNTDEVIVGGFSSGGYAAMAIIMDDAFPATGFIVLCPPRPPNFNTENVKKAKDRGIRGTIISTEMDPRFKDQQDMAETFKNIGLPHQFVPTPNIGHWFPEDLEAKIDQAILHYRQK